MSNSTYIIIPVYKGLRETVQCIESVLKYSSAYQLVVINDCSPDPEIDEYLEKLKKSNPEIVITKNDMNMGFPRTVNLGFQFDVEKDVIILNSDTVVTSKWVEKMRAWAYADPMAATVTPMSNSATIFSYPRICENNPLPDNLTIDELNLYFERASSYHGQECVEVPTGVGFCMYIKREFLTKAGYFNEELFGTGYGEENDFCLRCSSLGGKHLTATDTYIYHVDGVSFGSNRKTKQINNAMEQLDILYPDYSRTVQSWIESDPLETVRRRVDLMRLTEDSMPSILFVGHNLGGGVDEHIKDLASIFRTKGWRVFWLTPHEFRGCKLELMSPDEEFSITLDSSAWLMQLSMVVDFLGVKHLHFHHIANYHRDIYNMPRALGLPFDVTLHDYSLCCPRISGFIEEKNYYCGLYIENSCDQCIENVKNKYDNVYHCYADDIKTYRDANLSLLKGARKIIAPSHCTKETYKAFFPDLDIQVVPHPDMMKEWYVDEKNITMQSSSKDGLFTVGLLGGMGLKKGRTIFDECVELARKKNLPVRWVLVGYTDLTLEHCEDDYVITGPYGRDELPGIFSQYNINLVLIPALWPETFSYTLSESIALGCPVIVPALGALKERVEQYQAGIVVPTPITASSVVKEIESIIENPNKLEQLLSGVKSYTPVTSDSYFNQLYGELTILNGETPDAHGARPRNTLADQLKFERLIQHSKQKKLIASNQKLKNQLTLNEIHVKNLETMLSTESNELKRVRSEYSLTQQHVGNIEEMLSIEKDALKKVRSDQALTQQHVANIEKMNAGLSNELKLSKEHAQNVETANTHLMGEVNEYKARMENMEAEKVHLLNEVQQFSDQLKLQKQELEQQKQELELQKEELNLHKEELELKNRQIQDLDQWIQENSMKVIVKRNMKRFLKFP